MTVRRGPAPVLAAVVLATACTAPAPAPAPPPASGSASFACPPSFADGPPPAVGREGPFVPDGVDRVVLCTYYSRDGVDPVPLTGSRAIGGDPAALVAYLNRLPDGSPGACALIGGPTHVLGLRYPDRPPVTVTVRAGCAYVTTADATRSIDSVRRLREFWR